MPLEIYDRFALLKIKIKFEYILRNCVFYYKYFTFLQFPRPESIQIGPEPTKAANFGMAWSPFKKALTPPSHRKPKVEPRKIEISDGGEELAHGRERASSKFPSI